MRLIDFVAKYNALGKTDFVINIAEYGEEVDVIIIKKEMEATDIYELIERYATRVIDKFDITTMPDGDILFFIDLY